MEVPHLQEPEESRRTNWAQVKSGQAYLALTMNPEVYSANVCGHDYLVYPGVFPANKFHSTQFFTRNLIFAPGEEILEIGSGMGVTAIELALAGAGRVLATDISEQAVENTRINAARLGVDSILEARAGDLFAPLLPGESFDLIYWNIPFVYVPQSYDFASPAERSLFDPGYSQTRRFIEQAGNHLKDEGRLSFGFADFGEVEVVEDLLTTNSYRWKVAARFPSWEGRLVHYLLYEAKRA